VRFADRAAPLAGAPARPDAAVAAAGATGWDARPAPRVLHLDGGRGWAGGQNQVRLLMRELAHWRVPQCCICPAGAPLAERLAGEALPVETVPWRGGGDPRALHAIFRRLGGYDVLHAHDAHGVQVGLLPAAARRRPLIAHRRSLLPTRAAKWNRATRVVAISNAVHGMLLESGIDAARVVMIPDGVDQAEVAALPRLAPPLRERLGLAPGAFVVGNVASLFAYKRHDVLIAAAAKLTDAACVIIGDGPHRTALEQSVRSAGLVGRVYLPGVLYDARAAIREFDVFAFPSIGEALGTSVLDAMVLGVPVVAADADGPAEVLRPVHAATGVSLVGPGDATALAGAIARLRGDPGLRDRAVELQRERVAAFAIERTALRTLELYRALVRR
jgi:glycosyltransferase involved in cell wall biosynthesis